ncbi:MAG: hypothetical protein WAN74_02215 [Thermoplasmata archaeon]
MGPKGTLNGIAGVHLAAAELSLKGFSVAVTSRNTAGVDLYATSPKSKRSYSIQVKTSASINRMNFWPLENEPVEPHLGYFFVFVRINQPRKPNEFYIVPSSWVGKHSAKRRRKWNSFYRRDGLKFHDGWKLLR